MESAVRVKWTAHDGFWRRFGWIAIIDFCLFIPLFWAAFYGNTGEFWVFTLFASAFIITVSLFLLLYHGVQDEEARAEEFSQNCLVRTEHLIHNRLAELKARRQRLNEIRQNIDQEEDSELWTPVRDALEQGQDSLLEQRSQYQVELWKIETVRFLNRMEPLIQDWETLTDETCELRVSQCKTLSQEARNLAETWQRSDIAETETAQFCITRIENARDTCEMIRQQLVALEASLLIKGVPDPSPLPNTRVKQVLQTPDLMSSRVGAMHELGVGFASLETEYQRLKKEEDILPLLKTRS